ncbi:Zonadhesin [Ananas comosus]|uniref:Zonadhesin n=1 Tax=Ananas comosus TaxID=4615 RepID=A0A199W3P2_ANACO|nr:Zonadhesin [Ananas comosus]
MATELSADMPEPSAASDTSSSQCTQAAVNSLSAVLGPLPDPHLPFSNDPASALLRDPVVSAAVSRRLRLPSSGAGDDHLCRWLYDTFHSAVPALRLAVLSFLPALAGAYLSRSSSSSSSSHSPSGPRHPLAGFEAVLLALYAHETVRRGGEPETVTLPSLAAPSVYHEVKPPSKKAAAEAGELSSSSSSSRPAVVSPALEPHGTVRSTRRARIVGVTLELYYSNISQMPNFSKLEFCEFCIAWSGQGAIFKAQKQGSSPSASASQKSDFEGEVEGKRIPLPWELFQPMLRIVGHCLLGPGDSTELRTAAYKAAQCLHARAAQEIDSPAAVLASRSLIRLGKIAAAETEAAAEEATTEVKTAAPEAKEPATEAAKEAKTAAPEAKEPATEAATETKTAAPEAKEPATEAATETKTAAPEAKEPATEAATEAKTAAPEAKEPATEAATETKTAAPEAKEPATEAATETKTAAPEAKEPATEAATEAKTAALEAEEPATEAKSAAPEAKEPAMEAATEAKTTVPEAKDPAIEAKTAAPEAKEPATEAATEAKTTVPEAKDPAIEAKTAAPEAKEAATEEATEAATEVKTTAPEAKDPATEAKTAVPEANELATEAKESAVEAKDSAAAEAKGSDVAEAKESDAAEANRRECSELEEYGGRYSISLIFFFSSLLVIIIFKDQE